MITYDELKYCASFVNDQYYYFKESGVPVNFKYGYRFLKVDIDVDERSSYLDYTMYRDRVWATKQNIEYNVGYGIQCKIRSVEDLNDPVYKTTMLHEIGHFYTCIGEINLECIVRKNVEYLYGPLRDLVLHELTAWQFALLVYENSSLCEEFEFRFKEMYNALSTYDINRRVANESLNFYGIKLIHLQDVDLQNRKNRYTERSIL